MTQPTHKRMFSWIICSILSGLFMVAPAMADEDFAVRDIWFSYSEAGYAARADLSIQQPQRIDNILQGGYDVHLQFELNFIQPRQWWFNRQVGDITWHGILSFDALLDRYTLDTGKTEKRHFSSFAALIKKVSRLRSRASNSEGYLKIFQQPDIFVQVRFLMLVDNLPKPMQIDLLIDDSWNPSGSWQTFPLMVRS